MGLGTGLANVMLDAVDTYAVWLSLNTGNPGNNGANEVSGITRIATTWSPASNKVKTGATKLLTVPPAGSPTTVTHFSVWTAQTGGTFACGDTLSQPETYSVNGGTYALTPQITQTP